VLRELLRLDDTEVTALYKEGITADAPVSAASVRQPDLAPGLRNGSIKEVDVDYRKKLGLGPVASARNDTVHS
jgi:hypothetical protein